MKRRGHDDMITRYLRLLDSRWTDSSTVHVYSRQYEIIFGIIWVVSGVTGAGRWISVMTGRVCPDPRSVIDIIIASTLPQIETCNWNVKCLYDEDNYVDYSGDDIWPQLPHVMSPYTGDEYRRLTSSWPFRLTPEIDDCHRATSADSGARREYRNKISIYLPPNLHLHSIFSVLW